MIQVVARNEQHTERLLRIDEHRAAIARGSVLMEILRMRSEHLWACSMCSENDQVSKLL